MTRLSGVYLDAFNRKMTEVDGHSDACHLAGLRAVVEACAKVCDEYAQQRWAAYKTGNGPERASDFVQGQSDGGEECSIRIRRLSGQEEG